MKTVISTKNAPVAIGPYSQGVSLCKLIFTSGQIPIDPKTGAITEGIAMQTETALKNLEAVVIAGGGDKSSILKVNIFLTNMNDFAAVNEVYANFFQKPYPARSCVEVSKLPKDALIEIEATAAVL